MTRSGPRRVSGDIDGPGSPSWAKSGETEVSLLGAPTVPDSLEGLVGGLSVSPKADNWSMLEHNEKIVESRINDVQISERNLWKTQYFENTLQIWPEVNPPQPPNQPCAAGCGCETYYEATGWPRYGHVATQITAKNSSKSTYTWQNASKA